MSDRDINNWELRLKSHCDKHFDNYIRRRIDLGQARSDELWYLAGEFIYIEKVSSVSAYAQIRLDKVNNEQLDIVRGTRIETVFKQFYITNEAQSDDWIDLLVGINFKYFKPEQSINLSEAQAVISKACTNNNTNYTLTAQPCNVVTIKADVQNVGIIWVDFGQAAVQNSCFPLDPGDCVIQRCSNLDRLNFNAEIAGDDVHIIPEF